MTSARTVRPRARRLGVAGTALGALLLGLAAAPPAVNAAPAAASAPVAGGRGAGTPPPPSQLQSHHIDFRYAYDC
ncbi:hypothetical protein ABZ054_29390, partial [Streptomyces sp. NPDC006324]